MNKGELLVLAVVSFAAAAFGAYMTVYFTAKREQGSLKLPGVPHGPPPQMEPRPVPGTGQQTLAPPMTQPPGEPVGTAPSRGWVASKSADTQLWRGSIAETT